MSMIKLSQVSKYYKSEETVSVGMKRISLDFELGEFVAITGESGSGKSTLLNVVSGLDGYEDGELYLFGEETSHYTISDWEKYRSTYIGFVFQNYNIIDSFTVLQNVMFALEVQGYDPKNRKKRALELIDQVGLTSHKHHKASKLSGGQKQRTVIARALAKDCPIIVADEPTGNLDSESGKQVMRLLHDISKDKLIIVVTHDYDQVSEYATRKIKMHDGEVLEDKKIKPYQETHLALQMKPKRIPILTMLKFAARNLLATPKKLIFMLLLQIIVIGAFTIVYTDRISAVRETGLSQSSLYINTPKTRLLVEKRDGSEMTPLDLEKIKANRFSNQVFDDNFLFYDSTRVSLTSDFSSFWVNSTDTHHAILDRNIEGERPVAVNEIIFGANWGDISIGDEFILRDDYTYREIGTFIIVGIDKLKTNTIYFSDAYLNQEVAQEDRIDYSYFNEIYSNIAYGYSRTTYQNEDFDIYFDDYGFFNADLFLEGYGSREVLENQDITMRYEYKNVTYSIILQDISVSVPEELYGYGILTSDVGQQYIEDMLALVLDDEEVMYQDRLVSVSVDGYYAGNQLIKTLDKDLYKVYYPSHITSPLREFQVFFQGLLAVIYLTLFGLFLYSIVHAVSKNVMNSRKKDFAIFRSIGTNKSTLARVVVIEQVLMSVAGFVLALIIMNIISIYVTFLSTTLQYMEFIDYLRLLVIFMLFGVWLGLRFNKKVFKQSVIETLSQSKGE